MNFDTLREEFDRMSPEDQFRLGVAGVLRMAQSESDLRMPDDRMGYSSYPRNNRKDEETHLSKTTISDMTLGMSSKVYQVKITDAFQDIVAPMALAIGAVSDSERVHQNRLHHENTLYYQGIINAITGLGEQNRRSFVNAIYLNYQSFLRHPMWSTFTALNQYLIKPIARLGMGVLFGFGKKTDTDRIVDAIKEQTEFMKTGANRDPSMLQQLFRRGAVGFLVGGIVDNLKEAFKTESTDTRSPAIQTVEVLQKILGVNLEAFRALSSIERSNMSMLTTTMSPLTEITRVYSAESLAALHQLVELNGEILSETNKNTTPMTGVFAHLEAANDNVIDVLKMTGTDGMEAIGSLSNSMGSSLGNVSDSINSLDKNNEKRNQTSQEDIRNYYSDLFSRNMKTQQSMEGFYERFIEEQERARKELESHNRREKMRTTMGLLGGAALRTAIVGGIAHGLGLINNSITSALWSGFTTVAGVLSSAILDHLGVGGVAALGIGAAVATGLLRAGLATKAGLVVGAFLGFNRLVDMLSSWARARNGEPTSAEQIEAARASINWTAGETLRFDSTFSMTRERELNSLMDQRASLEERITEARRNRVGFARSDELIELNSQLRDVNNSIENIDSYSAEAGRVSAVALRTALEVAGQTNATSMSSRNLGGLSGLLSFIGQHESRGNYNALVYGNNTPREADLTNMSIAEVMQYQSQMIGRGHASTAVGKYQFLRGTLGDAVNATDGIDMNTQFTPEVQDRLAEFLLERRGLSRFQSGEMSPEQFARNLANEWASLPLVSGRSAYEGIAGNRAGVGYSELMDNIQGMRSSVSNFTDSTRSRASIPEFSFDEQASAISDSISSMLDALGMQQSQQPTTSEPTQAVISESSIRTLANAFQRAVEGMSGGPTIDLTGIGD